MIVEFVGVPGSGKSTLAPVARQILRDLGLQAMLVPEAGRRCLKRTSLGRLLCFVTPLRWQDRILWAVFRRLVVLYRLPFAIKNKTLIRQVWGVALCRRLSWRDRRSTLGWFCRDASYYQFFQSRLRPDEALILDEGLVHRATSLYTSAAEAPNRFKIINYTELLPRSDLVIWVQSPLDLCALRVTTRGINKRYLGKDLAPYIAHSAMTIELALQGIRSKGWDTVEIKNNGNLEACVTDLRSLLGKRGSGYHQSTSNGHRGMSPSLYKERNHRRSESGSHDW